MNGQPERPRDVTAAECLEALIDYRQVTKCRHCACLDWALAQLQEHAEDEIARHAARLRAEPEQVYPCPGCQPCPPADTALAWLRGSRHTPVG
jgi:hypothetical protein